MTAASYLTDAHNDAPTAHDLAYPRRVRIVMAVNNPGSNDYRVVKSAESAVEAGYECHVVGLLRAGLPALETINGVHYHRIALRGGLYGMVYGFVPECAALVLAPPRYLKLAHRAVARGVEVYRASSSALREGVRRVHDGTQAHWSAFRTRHASPPSAAREAEVTDMPAGPAAAERPRLWGLRNELRSLVSLAYAAARLLYKAVRWALRYGASRTRRYVRQVQRALRTTLRSKINARLNPTLHPLGVRFLFGRYLEALFPTLVALDGDIYHAHELWALESCALASRVRGAKLLYDSHELELHRNIAWTKPANARRIAYERRYLPQADAIFTVSEGLAMVIGREYARTDIQLLRNTPRRSTLAPAPTSLRLALGLAADTPLLVYTGSLTINRGLELVVEALTRLPEFHFATVGPWAAQTKVAVEQLAAEQGVATRVHLHPAVPPQVLIDFISGADIAVIPIQDACLSYHYCMPNKLFEAAFAGLPIVASNLPDVAKFIADNEIGAVFDTTDVDALTTAISRVYAARADYYADEKIERLRNAYAFEQESRGLLASYRMLSPAADDVTGSLV